MNCELDNGIYLDDTCHYYQVLQSLCVKIGINSDDKDQVTSVYFDGGCYGTDVAAKFVNAQVGKYYDFEETVSFQIRSNMDPYMVFTYVRDLGADFHLFLNLSYVCIFIAVYCFVKIMYLYCCHLKKFDSEGVQGSRRAQLEMSPNLL